MIRPIAAIDTDILINLLDTTGKPEAERRKAYIELTIERLSKLNARYVVPVPVVAELCRDGKGSDQLREVVRQILRKLRVEVLDEDAADIAGTMLRTTLKKRPEGKERGAVKFDALIAAIAHKIGAKWLLTANETDMRACLSVVSSSVELVIATEPPETGQTVMLHVLKPGAATS